MKAMTLVAALIVAGNVASAADVRQLELQCIDPQEFVNDNIYVEFHVDGNHVKFGLLEAQRGTHRKKRKPMNEDTVLIFDQDTRLKLSGSTELRVIVMEYDPFRDKLLGEVRIPLSSAPNRSSDDVTGSTKLLSWHYRLKWDIQP